MLRLQAKGCDKPSEIEFRERTYIQNILPRVVANHITCWFATTRTSFETCSIWSSSPDISQFKTSSSFSKMFPSESNSKNPSLKVIKSTIVDLKITIRIDWNWAKIWTHCIENLLTESSVSGSEYVCTRLSEVKIWNDPSWPQTNFRI